MLVCVDENVAEMDLGRTLEEISPARREYALRYRNELDRKLSVAVYLLLKKGLREEYGLEENPVLSVGPSGKPFLPEHPEIHFNFSHCSRAAACVVSSCPIGIDVETISPVDWDVAERVLSSDELKEVRRSSRPDVAFARYWTMKEALVKLHGGPLDERLLPGLLASCGGETTETRVAANYVLSLAKGVEGAVDGRGAFVLV